MLNLTIERGIPIPPRTNGRPRGWVFQLEVGDSVWVGEKQGRACSRLWRAKELGRQFTTRKEGDGTRIWRTA